MLNMINIKLLSGILGLAVCTSCSGFLDVKPDQKMAIPYTLEHADLLLNDYSTMNASYPTLVEIGSDDYYLNTSDWLSLSDIDERNAYVWSDEENISVFQWANPYKTVYISNQVLEVVDQVDRAADPALFDRVKGGAYFFRAFAFHQLARIFARPYNAASADRELGIPLRLSPDIDYASVRSSLIETYDQILADYKLAASSLPLNERVDGRPSRAAAYAALARVYLDMAQYDMAYLYADSALTLHPVLLDFNTLDWNSAAPVPHFNTEVLFPATSMLAGPLGQSFARVDSNLYDAYEVEDLRKVVYFQEHDFDPDTYFFKGSYDNTAAGIFVGLTTSEMLLIRAESAVRTGRDGSALSDLNTLRRNRLQAEGFTELQITAPDALLEHIIAERRKELIFRGLRWADLRRLNQEPAFAKGLVRIINGTRYELSPNSLKYTAKIPVQVIEQTGMPQNNR